MARHGQRSNKEKKKPKKEKAKVSTLVSLPNDPAAERI